MGGSRTTVLLLERLGRAGPEHRSCYSPFGMFPVSVELVFGVLKEQRGMRQVRRRGMQKVGVEFALAATAFDLTRLSRLKPDLA